MISRRNFGKVAVGGAFAVAVARPVVSQSKPKVVVIGGGPGGGTVARYLAKDGAGAIDVTLVEPQKAFVTCFHSNLYLGGLKSIEQITHGYGRIASQGVKVVHQVCTAIERDKRLVKLDDGSSILYDRLVVAPGIDLKYDSVPGYSRDVEELMPHGWKAGPQTKLLKSKLDAVPDGGLIVMIAPPNPYRCPPGPYERVSMMAHVLKAAGKTKSKIIVVDTKDKFSKQGLFQEGWEKHYPGMIEWLPPSIHEGIKSVDAKSGTIVTGFETYKNVALANVIPAQMAGKIARDADLADASGFCPIDAANMKSRVDQNIFVIGDACIPGDMPKSAFAANSQAKIAAIMIRGELTAARTFSARFTNTCWSLIASDDAVKVGGRYENKEGVIAAVEGFISQTGETAELRKQTQQENMGWYDGIVADIFG